MRNAFPCRVRLLCGKTTPLDKVSSPKVSRNVGLRSGGRSGVKDKTLLKKLLFIYQRKLLRKALGDYTRRWSK